MHLSLARTAGLNYHRRKILHIKDIQLGLLRNRRHAPSATNGAQGLHLTGILDSRPEYILSLGVGVREDSAHQQALDAFERLQSTPWPSQGPHTLNTASVFPSYYDDHSSNRSHAGRVGKHLQDKGNAGLGPSLHEGVTC